MLLNGHLHPDGRTQNMPITSSSEGYLHKGEYWVWHDTASGGKDPVLELWGAWSHSFNTITPMSTLVQSGSTC